MNAFAALHGRKACLQTFLRPGAHLSRTPFVPHSVLVRMRFGAMERKKNGQGGAEVGVEEGGVERR